MKTKVDAYLNSLKTRYEDQGFKNFLADVVGKVSLKNAIHITGTNGKGSTATYLANTLQASGYKVGLFTSPHFESYTELAHINGQAISPEYVYKTIKLYEDFIIEYSLSAFEIMTFVSFKYFNEQHVDFTLVEVGLGGRRDATNIFTPLLSVITNIGFDHTKELGNTLTKIAYEKGGIIKQGVPVLLGPCQGEAEREIKRIASEKEALLINVDTTLPELKEVDDKLMFKLNNKEFLINTKAHYEVKNALFSYEIIQRLRKLGFTVTDEAFSRALLIAPPIGRFNVVRRNPDVIIDGAHNPHAFKELINGIKSDKKLKVIFGAFKDKDYKSELDMLALANAEVVVTSFNHPRALQQIVDREVRFVANHVHLIKQELKNLKADELLLITGSLYFAMLVSQEFKKGIYE